MQARWLSSSSLTLAPIGSRSLSLQRTAPSPHPVLSGGRKRSFSVYPPSPRTPKPERTPAAKGDQEPPGCLSWRRPWLPSLMSSISIQGERVTSTS
ncbi:S100 protein, beta polypeptide, isoform CRA_a [Rattus norvegicus]|uniref:S100 protein, beta polypeptide, isoform CRA_a n=1 Tax=Rattus norvegicus TaxID=10116 RepID=A6JKE0_RAT|nr:S100 protein, beta polypeptide, isoform CRA_a [Rattus norvegicus]